MNEGKRRGLIDLLSSDLFIDEDGTFMEGGTLCRTCRKLDRCVNCISKTNKYIKKHNLPSISIELEEQKKYINNERSPIYTEPSICPKCNKTELKLDGIFWSCSKCEVNFLIGFEGVSNGKNVGDLDLKFMITELPKDFFSKRFMEGVIQDLKNHLENQPKLDIKIYLEIPIVGEAIKKGDLYKNKGPWKAWIKELNRLVELCQQVVQKHPSYERAWKLLGDSYYWVGQGSNEKTARINCYKKVLEINPKNDLVWLELGMIYENEEERQKAIEHFEKYLECTLEHPVIDFWVMLGGLYFGQGNFIKAIECYEKTIENREEIDKEFDWVWGDLADAYDSVGNWQKALQYFIYLNEKDPSDKLVSEKLSSLKVKLLQRIKEVIPIYEEITFEKLSKKVGVPLEQIAPLMDEFLSKKEIHGKIWKNTIKFDEIEVQQSSGDFNESLNFFEEKLRDSIELVLSKHYTDGWNEGVFPVIKVKGEHGELLDPAEKQLENTRKKDMELVLAIKSYRRIEFIEFSKYYGIISYNWTLFEKILHDKNRINVYFQEISHARNTFAHHRKLDPELRTTCEIYMRRILNMFDAWKSKGGRC